MAKPDLGLKRQCQACGAKFFDFNREKPVCPKCGTPFQSATPSRGSARPVADTADDDDEKSVEGGADLVTLEDADAAEGAAVVDPDADASDDEGAADTFLEEEEEDGDDVAGLIDGDLETDEEP